MIFCMLYRCGRGADEMSVAAHCWIGNVVAVVVLKPKVPIDGTVAPIGWMGEVYIK